MSKKLLIISLVIILIIGSGLFFFLLKGNQISPLVPQVVKEQLEKLKIDGEEVYQDEAGFVFKYPAKTKVADSTPEEPEYYSLLEITQPQTSGKITISIKDTNFTKTADWVKKNLKEAQLVGAVSLGNIQGTQYIFTSEGQNYLKTVAIDQSIIYEITGLQDSGFWEDSINLITSSFTFGKSQTTQSSAREPVSFEEEEVVE